MVPPVTGYCSDTTPKILKNSLSKSTWKRSMVIDLEYKIATITWECDPKHHLDPLQIKTPVPVGIINAFKKSQELKSLNFKSVPMYVKTWAGFEKRLTKAEFDALKLKSSLSFADPKKTHDSFTHLYCVQCEKPRLQEIWHMHAEKLPAEMTIQNLFSHWDKLGLSWNWNDVLGAMLPNKEDQYVVFNARKIVTDAYEHATVS